VSQFFKDLTTPFYGANRSTAKVSEGLRDSFWLQGMLWCAWMSGSNHARRGVLKCWSQQVLALEKIPRSG
jgi:hypothetical protein